MQGKAGRKPQCRRSEVSEPAPSLPVARGRPGFTAKTGANFRPQKRLHRTVWRAWLLSSQERKSDGLQSAGSGWSWMAMNWRGIPHARQGASRVTAAARFQNRPQACPWRAGGPDSLQKQEQISGPENAPIARFDGLGCYQSGSESGHGLRARATWAGMGGNGREWAWAAKRRRPNSPLAAGRSVCNGSRTLQGRAQSALRRSGEGSGRVQGA